jgi:predicted nuclease of predicted toxin-antitoxin system
MKLLVDECIDERLRLLFRGYDCQTARYANLAGLKNGQLLDAAEAAGFDILITADQNIPNQQNLDGRKISLMILCAPTNRLRDLAMLVSEAISTLGSIRPGDVVRIRTA